MATASPGSIFFALTSRRIRGQPCSPSPLHGSRSSMVSARREHAQHCPPARCDREQVRERLSPASLRPGGVSLRLRRIGFMEAEPGLSTPSARGRCDPTHPQQPTPGPRRPSATSNRCHCGRTRDGLWGRHLRHFALAVLLDTPGTCSIREVLDELERRGHRVASRQAPGKALADGLAERCTSAGPCGSAGVATPQAVSTVQRASGSSRGSASDARSRRAADWQALSAGWQALSAGWTREAAPFGAVSQRDRTG